MKRTSKKWLQNLILSFSLTLLLPLASFAAELTAHEVMIKVDKREDGDTRTSEMTMILIDRKGNQRVRKIKQFSKDYGEDKKSISFFLSPADVRDTSFLSFDWDDAAKDDDNWLYLPALRKVKRISAGNKKDSFMGSDFTYADMNGMEVSEWDHKFLRESMMVDGHDCWVIEATPKKEFYNKVVKETDYLKSISWVRKDNFMVIQGKTWVKKGKKIKLFRIPEAVQVQGIWTAKRLEMTTTKGNQKEHSTVILFDNTVYNQGVEDDMFATQRMERGL